MPTVISIDPVTRLEGHLKIEATVDYVQGVQQVVDAHAVGTMFRGLETILMNRTSSGRPGHHPANLRGLPGLARHGGVDGAGQGGQRRPSADNARIMRNLVLGANFIQSHILHFYHLAASGFRRGAGHGALAAELARGQAGRPAAIPRRS